MAILLENIQEQNRATIEAVLSTEQKRERQVSDLREGLSLRLDALEIAMRASTAEIRRLGEGFASKPDAADLAVLDKRVAALEARAAP